MSNPLVNLIKSRAIERLVRVAGASSLTPVLMTLLNGGSVSLPDLLATISGNPWLVAATPLIVAAAKELRMRYGDRTWVAKFFKYIPV